MRWPDRRRRLADTLLNRPPPGSWSDLACATFGSPWLELVVRAGSARDGAEAAGNESEHHAIDAAALEVWATALRAQAQHHKVNGGDRVARDLATTHAQLVDMVEEMEAVVAGARLRHAAPSSRLTADIRDQADRIRALRQAAEEVERTDRGQPA